MKFHFVHYQGGVHTTGQVVDDLFKLPQLYGYGWKKIGIVEVVGNKINIIEPLVDVQKFDSSWDYSFLRSSNVVLNQWLEKKCFSQSFDRWILDANKN
jgi:hypothetical protein